MDVLLNVIKNIFCDSCDDNKKHSLCHLIDLNNLPSFKIIEPDGNFIKKNQILELKSLFSKNSQYTNECIYIIKGAERMNKESANTMLKFLEEPDGNVIGFFLTNQLDNVMLTIQSRCQHIECNFKNSLYEKLNITEEKYVEYKKIIIEYLNSIETENNELILCNKKYLYNYEKSDIVSIFKIILEIYLSVLTYTAENDFKYLKKYSFSNIRKKINILVEFLKNINYNVNLELFLDKFVIEMDGVNNEGL